MWYVQAGALRMTVLELFAGAGGLSLGATRAGVTDLIGIEWDKTACATAEAAGHKRICADVSMVPTSDYVGIEGLFGSPPCQAWSTAGRQLGRLDRPRIEQHLDRIEATGRWMHYAREGWHDPNSPLVLEPLRFILDLRPTWIVLEQVPQVLPLWHRYVQILQGVGYSAVTASLYAEQYGVPQTRKRAILIARLDAPAHLPEPTHRRYRYGMSSDPTHPHLKPYVSMAQALGWGMTNRPSTTLVTGTGGGHSLLDGGSGSRRTLCNAQESGEWLVSQRSNYSNSGPSGATAAERGRTNRAIRDLDEPAATIRYSQRMNANDWIYDRPATTIAGDSRVFQPGGHHEPGEQSKNAIRITVQEAAILQTYPADYPWQGNKSAQYRQIGDGVPPMLAEAVVRAAIEAPPAQQVMIRAAVVSNDGRYRYMLSRSWDPLLPCVLFVMLNPSTADGLVDDATIRKCIGFAKLWGYGGIWVVNLYALRATDQRELWLLGRDARIGPRNDAWIQTMAQIAGDHVVLAWGAHNTDLDREHAVMQWVREVKCLGWNADGSPRHPLMLAYDTQLVAT